MPSQQFRKCCLGNIAKVYPIPYFIGVSPTPPRELSSMADTVKKTLLIPREEYEKFRRTLPMHGAFVWFVREALRCFNELNDIDPKEFVKLAVDEISLTDD